MDSFKLLVESNTYTHFDFETHYLATVRIQNKGITNFVLIDTAGLMASWKAQSAETAKLTIAGIAEK